MIKVIDQKVNKIKELEQINEEYISTYSKMDSQIKSLGKKYQELMKKLSQEKSENRSLIESIQKVEHEKLKLSERWIKLSNKNKFDDKVKLKLKELETSNEYKDKVILNQFSKIEELENIIKAQKEEISLNNTFIEDAKAKEVEIQKINNAKAKAMQKLNECHNKIDQQNSIYKQDILKVEESKCLMLKTISKYETQIEDLTNENHKLKKLCEEIEIKYKEKEIKANQELIKKLDEAFSENELLREESSKNDQKINELMIENKQYINSIFDDQTHKVENNDSKL